MMSRACLAAAVVFCLILQLSDAFLQRSKGSFVTRQDSNSRRNNRLSCASSVDSSSSSSSSLSSIRSNLPQGDELDKKIFAIALPAMVNFAILPLVGAVDTFFVGNMGNALALAATGAANQVFTSTFWIISFLPSVVTPVVAKAVGSGDKEAVKERVGEALFLGTVMGLMGFALLFFLPHQALNLVLPVGSETRKYAAPYLSVRALTCLPALLSTVGFSVFRGSMDVLTPLKISLLSNLINVILDPLLIFNCGMGVVGAAAATCVAEIVAFGLYVQQLLKKGLMSKTKIPSFENLKPLLLGGIGVQLRAVALNIAFLSVTRTTQALDTTGTAAAAHAITIQLWQLGGVVLLAMSSVAGIMVPAQRAISIKEGKKGSEALLPAKLIAERLLLWGAFLGVTLAAGQLLALPLLSVFSPLKEVQTAARLPSIIGAALQIINGVVFVGEGIQQGNQAFVDLAITTTIATVGMLTSLRLFGSTLAGVWGSFAVFNGIRLLGVARHHFLSGPFASRNMAAADL